MDRQTAAGLITQTFEAPFDEQRFGTFVRNLFNRIDDSKAFSQQGAYIPDAFKDQVHQYKRLGTYIDPEGAAIDILIVHLKRDTALDRARTMQRNFVARHLRQRDEKDAAVVAYYTDGQPDWRFSLVKMEYEVQCSEETGRLKVAEALTPARRYSFLVGQNEPNHTAQQQLVPILQDTRHNPTLAQLEAAFNIESVTNEFFQKYKDLFLDLRDELDLLTHKQQAVKKEFERAGIDTANFAKKLLGQIVFLYFLQKKGWLGVAQGQAWGSGPKDFLRRLFEKKGVAYTNFFNDVLEPLFYEALAIERRDNFYAHLGCRIPFLNGGLFEPVGNYDWQTVDIPLSNPRFGDIFGTFDLFNFTVREDEPLEKEVAVDPEMLGKVFENLLEVSDRKSKGAFYTPREIVHYMCQESLINYLDTSLNAQTEALIPAAAKQEKLFGEPDPEQLSLSIPSRTTADKTVPRQDIDILVRQGEFCLEHDAAKAGGTASYQYRLPQTIRDNAAAIDDALADIKICDPAIGSGAFPVGLMQEIVKARGVLTTYLSPPSIPPKGGQAQEGRGEGRTPYAFKRHAIQESIYGVDIDPGAVDIAKLRLWLSLVVDEDSYAQIQPLPNLAYKIVCGNSLVGFPENWNSPAFTAIEQLKRQYFSETDSKKKAGLKAEVDSQIQERLAKSKQVFGYKVDFDFRLFFSEVFHHNGGFDVVVGNPPYNEIRDLDAKEQEKCKTSVYYKHALGGRVNLFQFFYPLALDISKKMGLVSLITQNSILAENSTKKNRQFITKNSTIIKFVSFPERDDPKRRVFEHAKMSVCIGFLRASKPTSMDYKFSIIVWYDKFFENGHSLKLHLSDVKSIYPEDLVFPISTERSFHILKKLKQMQDVFYINAKSGEVDMTKFRDRFNISKIGYRVLTGAQILRYRITDNPSQGDVIYLDTELSKFSRDKIGDIKGKRIVMQRITGVDSKIRLIMTIVPGHILCANSTNYLPDNQVCDLRIIIGILSSTLMNFYFKQTSTNTNITTGELNNIPIAKVPNSANNHFIDLVDQILATKKTIPAADVSALEAEIDQLVYQLYGLTAEEIAIVEGSVG